MAKTSTPVTSTYLLKGAVYALEQCGLLLREANSLYRSGSYASAVALAAFAREELGRAKILFDLRARVVAGELVTEETIIQKCSDHVTKQEWGVSSLMYTAEINSVLGKLLQTKMRAHPQSEEWKAADIEIKKLDELRLKRIKHDRHEQRMRALYIEPDASGAGWNRPRDIGQTTAHEFLSWAANDYSTGGLQKLEPDLLKAFDDRMLRELLEWTERPTPPRPEWPPLAALNSTPSSPPQASNRVWLIIGVAVVIVAAAGAIISLLR